MEVKEQTYEEIVLANPGRKLEMYDGVVREKPAMSIAHNRVMWRLIGQLQAQLDFDRFDMRGDSGRVQIDESYVIPDVYIIPIPRGKPIDDDDYVLEIFEEPLPFVAEVWSPSTGDHDLEEKIPRYRLRGDREIWRLHPRDALVSAWRREPNGLYTLAEYRGGSVELAAIPGVVIDLVDLFA